MDKKIEQIRKWVKKELGFESSGHDYWHAFRVWKLAQIINKKEKANKFVIEASSLIHDIADRKLNNNDIEKGFQKVKKYLEKIEVEKKIAEKILFVVRYVSFSSDQPKNKSLELKIVQDADRLDALGAIGIARTFAYGGKSNAILHNPEIKPKTNLTKKEYKKHKSTSINHFYEKLLLLKDEINTKTGKKIAEERHKYMLNYLEKFKKEWEGKI